MKRKATRDFLLSYLSAGFVVTSVVGLVVSLVTLACWRPRPPPHLLLHPWARGKGAAPPTRQDDGRWDEHDSHFRYRVLNNQCSNYSNLNVHV